MLNRLFGTKERASTSPPTMLATNTLIVERGNKLLQPHKPLIRAIKTKVGVPEGHWDRLYMPLLDAYAELCQRFPASEAHHHAELGGLLRHGLETLHEALLLRRDILLPNGAAAEVIAQQQDIWTYAVCTAALLHDIGKPITDLRVTVTDSKEPILWSLLAKPLPIGSRYSFHFDRHRQYHRHQQIPPLLVSRLIPPVALEWLTSEPQVCDQWLPTLSGDESGGQLVAIVHEADRRSSARDLTGGVVSQRSTASRIKPLHERLLTTLRYLVAEDKVTLNRPGASGFVANGRLWLVSKRVLDDIRAQMTAEGQPGVPGRNDRLMDELQQWQILEPNGDKAIWRCQITIGDWSQALSLICLDLAKVWNNLNDVPTVDGITVVPTTNDDAAKDEVGEIPASSVATASPAPAAGPVQQVSQVDMKTASDTPLTESSQVNSLDDELPLPFDPPAMSAVQEKNSSQQQASHESTHDNAPVAEPTASSTHQFNDPDDPGHRFVRWLIENIKQSRAQINTPRARMHVVPEGLLLITPAIFRDFSPEKWDRAQKRFQKLKLHTKTPEDTNVWSARVSKDRKQSLIKVMLISDPEKQLGVKLPPCNEAISIINDG